MPISSFRLLTSLTLALLMAACANTERRTTGPLEPASADAVVWTPDRPEPVTSIGAAIQGRAVEAILTEPEARYAINASPERLAELRNPFPPTPKTKRAKSRFVGPGEPSRRSERAAARATQTTIESIDTQTNIDNTGGSLVIPADAHGAAGPNHVVAVTNVSIEFLTKTGTLQLSTSLRNFFGSLAPPSLTFDPKVLYDQYEERWLVVTLERSDAPESSSILLAVSDDSDPNGAWTQVRIDSSVVINGNTHWLDYPGFAVDDQAVYITGNMFRYFDGSAGEGSFGGVRLFIVDKGTAGGFYAGGGAAVSLFDPIPTGAFGVTHQPAHTFGAVPGSIGTWLIGWSGLNAGGNSAYQVVSVDDPLASPTFTASFVFFGNVDDLGGALPDAPQAGSATGGGNIGVATNDRRALNAVWRDDGLWVAHSFRSNSAPDAGQVTAGWARIDTSAPAALVLDQFGSIGGEDIAPGTHTFFPALAVNDDGGMMLGFSASAPSINPGAYYSYRTPTDPDGTLRGSTTIRAGLDYYQRRFGGPRNRWGDYSGAALDPDGACFWIYNKYAIPRGTGTGPGEDGRWGTAFAQFCNDAPTASNDAASVMQGQTVTVLATGQASVLANDSDPDDSDLLVVTTAPVSGPDHASAFTLNADGTFSYSHDNTANLVDTVVYEVCDDGSPIRCDTGTIQITIQGDNAAPIALDDSAIVAEGGTVTVLTTGNSSVLGNDSDPNADAIAVNGPPNPSPTNASSISLNPDGTFSYTHDGSESSADAFGYEICDDGTPVRCASATVALTITEVNDPPSAAADMLASVQEDAGLQSIPAASLLANDSPGPGETGQTLTITAVAAPMGGTVQLNGAQIEFTPAADYNGPAGFEYQVTDDGTTNGAADPRSALATAMFTITEVNDPPLATGETLSSIPEDSGTRFIATADLLVNDDPGPIEAGQSLTITSVGGAVGGIVVLNGSQVEFTPAPEYSGPASFDYVVTDDGTTGGVPDPQSDSATASFTIDAVNDPPVAVNDEFVTDIDQLLSEDVSLNDSDIDSTVLTYSVVSASSAGSLTLNADGTFDYQPDSGFAGEDGFVYRVSDGDASSTATVTIRVVDLVFFDSFEG